MRKRIAIIVLGAAAVALAAHLLVQPKPGTVDYHKAEYLKAKNRLEGKTFLARCSHLLEKTTGIRTQMAGDTHRALSLRLEEHKTALLELGYLIEHQIVVTNDWKKVWASTVANRQRVVAEEYARYTEVAGAAGHVLYLVGRPSDMAKWEEAIRKLDVPESRKE